MKNILLVFENSIEFDFVRVILSTLGFNVLSLNKKPEVRQKIKDVFPDLVVTSSLAANDDILAEIISRRTSTGAPKFIWVGSSKQLKALTETQMACLDDKLATPIQPDKLIESACQLLGLPSKELIAKYREWHAKSSGQAPDPKNSLIFVSDKERKNRYDDVLTRVENLDRVFSVKDMLKTQPPAEKTANSEELLEKKRSFVKALFKK